MSARLGQDMRKLLGLLLAALMLSGCSGQTDDGNDDGLPDANGLGGNATVPDPLHWENDVVVGADPFNNLPTDPNDPTSLTGPPPCSQDVSSCEYYEFTVNGTASLTATLAWGIAANDIDLYLFQGTTEVSRDGINSLGAVGVPPTSQVMHAKVDAGTYTFWVVLWNAAADSYILDVEFAQA